MSDTLPHMPEVEMPPDIERYFAQARQLVAAHQPGDHPDQRYIVLITPGRLLLPIACPPPGSSTPEMLKAVERLVPAVPPRQISVIAFTQIIRPGMGKPLGSVASVSQVIPFLGYLMGFGYLGHTVTIFEGHPSALAAGCRDADLLIVDKAMIPHLQNDWAAVAFAGMRDPAAHILVFGRDGTVSKIVKKGPQAG